MRVLGVDYGQRRIGLAVSDPTGLLARPLRVLQRPGGDERTAAASVVQVVSELEADGEPIAALVVGWPRRLDGSPNEQTPLVEAFAAALRQASRRPVHLQDERLTSHEADQRLALRERDWRRRKAQLDAAAAAIVLQDYLDQQPLPPALASDDPDACAG